MAEKIQVKIPNVTVKFIGHNDSYIIVIDLKVRDAVPHLNEYIEVHENFFKKEIMKVIYETLEPFIQINTEYKELKKHMYIKEEITKI